MKKTSSIIFALSFATTLMAQTKVWHTPYVGYANSRSIKIEKIEFAAKKTSVYASVKAAAGSKFRISPETALVAEDTRYQIKKASRGLLDKTCTMPDSGIVHFEMTFPPVPADTRILHFTEGQNDDYAWRLCNIREKKEDLPSAMPSEWQDITYTQEGMLPTSTFCDDSTKIHVTISHYTPEAATDIRLSYPIIDAGTTAYGKRYPISHDGKADISIHPCFPITVYMQIGDAAKYPVLVEPGKDMNILVDMGDANDAMPTVHFKGAWAKVNYEMNAKGAKDKMYYRNDDAYYDSIYTTKKNLNTIISERISEISLSCRQACYHPATQQYMEVLNGYEVSNHCYYLNDYISRRISATLKKESVNEGILLGINSCDFAYWYKSYLKRLLSGDMMTLCPYFTTTVRFDNVPLDERFKDFDGVVNTYNKDIFCLNEALAHRRSGYDDTADHWQKKICDSTLNAYCTIAAKRWEDKLAQMNKTSNVHICKNINLSEDALRAYIMDKHRGKTVAFVAFNKKRASSVTQLQDVFSFIEQSDPEKTAFIMIDLDFDQDDYADWYSFATQHKGEYYTDMNQSYRSLFGSRQGGFDSGCYFMVYSADGTCLLSSKDTTQFIDKMKECSL